MEFVAIFDGLTIHTPAPYYHHDTYVPAFPTVQHHTSYHRTLRIIYKAAYTLKMESGDLVTLLYA
jgi:hypothetical protein